MENPAPGWASQRRPGELHEGEGRVDLVGHRAAALGDGVVEAIAEGCRTGHREQEGGLRDGSQWTFIHGGEGKGGEGR